MSNSVAAHLGQSRDLSYSDWVKRAGLQRRGAAQLGFDPRQVKFYDKVVDGLALTDDETAMLRSSGVVGVDHSQIYSMSSAYFAIYTRDLPVLVTTDSILHALHRSYDAMLEELEGFLLMPVLKDVLDGAHTQVREQSQKLATGPADTALKDVDLYLTVARNLLAGGGAPPPKPAQSFTYEPDEWDGKLSIQSALGQDSSAQKILQAVAAQRIETDDCSSLYGGPRCVDYSQFTPRGHYTHSRNLKRYFRAMMWMGRADLAFRLSPGTGQSRDPKLTATIQREQRAAIALAWVIERAGKTKSMTAFGDTIDYFVGRTDSATLAQLTHAMRTVGLSSLEELKAQEKVDAIVKKVTTAGEATQHIRSEVIAPKSEAAEAEVPQIFGLSGQRFVLDAFVLSKVVYDSIVYQGKRQERLMPSGLDVMAALGNDEAAALLEPEINKYHYAANLASLRRTISENESTLFDQNVYGRWLDALRTLDDVPDSEYWPKAMQSRAWQHKMLNTQLASWAELRHDTVLYAKQSYTSQTACAYPTGYVEPYPEFFRKIAELTDQASKRLKATSFELPDAEWQASIESIIRSQSLHYERFARTVARLQHIAESELAGRPLSDDDATFLKKTIDRRGGGSGPPQYSGWYPTLIYGMPEKWEPTIVDVHTNPGQKQPGILEVGVGNANFLVVAIDNGPDRAVYAGPVSSYYEFVAPLNHRLTDEEWQTMLHNPKSLARPEWTQSYQPGALRRKL